MSSESNPKPPPRRSKDSAKAQVLTDKAFPTELEDLERSVREARRAFAFPPSKPDTKAQNTKSPALIGVALSGGGIRSATFALGVFQALAKANLVRHIDYLSTVSGGGYFGAFLGALSSRRGVDDAATALQTSTDPALLNLRRNGKYLAPAGTTDILLGGAVLLRNWIAVQVVLLTFLVMFFLGAQAILLQVFHSNPGWSTESLQLVELQLIEYDLWLSPWVTLPLGILLFVAVPLGWSYWTVGRNELLPWFGGWRRAFLGWVWMLLPHAFVAAAGACAVGYGEVEFGVVCVWIAVVSLVVAWVAMALPSDKKEDDPPSTEPELSADDLARYRVSVWLQNTLVGAAMLLAFAVFDTLGRSLYVAYTGEWPSVLGASGGVSALLLTLASFARKAVVSWSSRVDGKRPGASTSISAWIAAGVLVVVVLTGVSFAAQAVTWQLESPTRRPAPSKNDPIRAKTTLRDGSAKIDLVVEMPGCATCEPTPVATGVEREQVLWSWVAFAIAFGGCFFLGTSQVFLNRSTHLPLYSARITRAFVGASNPRRDPSRFASGGPGLSAATRVVPDDDITAGRYWGWGEDREHECVHWRKGNPLHIVNVTINETVDGRSKTREGDQRGVGLAVGPCALSAGVSHHLLPGVAADNEANDVVFRYPEKAGAGDYPYERMSLGQWTAISGAAFSTGLGSRTHVGLSLLAGFTNVRLGHWWRPGIRWNRWKSAFSVFWVQTYLFRELLARFPGVQRPHWYLSDGGHFENMGGYELIRRRLDFMVVIDAEADPNSEFEGLGNFVRKARTDFEAEIEFVTNPLDELTWALDSADPDRGRPPPPVGPFPHLRRGKWVRSDDAAEAAGWTFEARDRGGRSLARAALAKVTYADEDGKVAPRWLLYVKPVLLEHMPVDLQHYATQHEAFPHEPTVDQFFDEAQWESYRKLGQLTGEELFPAAGSGRNETLSKMLRGEHPLLASR